MGTLLGTIYIARSETRKRKRDELTTARLHGATMTLRIAHMRARLGDVALWLVPAVGAPMPITRSALVQCVEILGSLTLWKIEELIPLAPLPNGTAVKLAEANDQIKTALRMVQAMISDFDLSSQEDDSTNARKLSTLLQGTMRFLTEVMQECRAGAVALHLEQD